MMTSNMIYNISRCIGTKQFLLQRSYVVSQAVVSCVPTTTDYNIHQQRFLSTSDKFAAKEKVEEDRYIREQEMKFFEKKKAEAKAEMNVAEQEQFQKQVAPVMVQIQEILKTSNDTVSSTGLEAIARWKLGL